MVVIYPAPEDICETTFWNSIVQFEVTMISYELSKSKQYILAQSPAFASIYS